MKERQQFEFFYPKVISAINPHPSLSNRANVISTPLRTAIYYSTLFKSLVDNSLEWEMTLRGIKEFLATVEQSDAVSEDEITSIVQVLQPVIKAAIDRSPFNQDKHEMNKYMTTWKLTFHQATVPGEYFQKPGNTASKRPNEEYDTAHSSKKRKTDTQVRKAEVTPIANVPEDDDMERLKDIISNELELISQQASTGKHSPSNL